MKTIPRLALVGRPNVGKSTLFNRICGRRKAITDSRPGSTRDRNYAQASWQGHAFELVDTGGLLLGSDDPLLGPATVQAERAIEEAEAVMYAALSRGLSFKLTMGNILTLTPALTITREEMDRALTIIEKCLTEVEQGA